MKLSKWKIILAYVILAVLFILACDDGTNSERHTRLMFDTVVNVTIESDSGRDLSPLFESIWAELGQWEKALDAYDSSGGVFLLNLEDTVCIGNEKTLAAIRAGLNYIAISDSAFDIRVGGIIRLWDFTGKGYIPSDSALYNAIRYASLPVELDSATLIKNRNTMLDVGGLGKGIAADAVAEMLDTIAYVQRYIIDLGGNIAANDKSGKPFVIGIRDPRSPNDAAAKFMLQPGNCCATAGDYQRYFERDGVRYHHIIDPKTGRPARRVSSVTVVATNAMTADILSTSLFVMGHEKGMNFLKSHEGIRAAFFDSDGKHIGGNLKIEMLNN